MGKTDDTSVSEAQAGGNHKKSHKLRLRGFNLFSVIVFIVAMSFLGFKIIDRKQTAKSGCGGQATSPIYDKAATLLEPSKTKELKILVDEIKTKNNYDKDPNCLLPITLYYMNIEDEVSADKYISLIERVYSPTGKFASAYQPRIKNLDDLKSNYTYLKKLHQSDKNNTSNF